MPGRVNNARVPIAVAMLCIASLACAAPIGGNAEPTAGAQAAAVIFIAPENNSTIAEGSTITFAVNASNGNAGVSKVDFLVDDTNIGTQAAAAPQPSSFTAQQTWVAKGTRGHFVDAIAYGDDGKQFGDDKITIQVVAAPGSTAQIPTDPRLQTVQPLGATATLANVPTLAGAAPTSQPAATAGPTFIIVTSAPPTNDPNAKPTLTVKAPNLNIRAGDGTNFNVIGAMKTGDVAQIVGRNAAKSWWVIQKDTTRGWVIADPQFSDVKGDTSKVPLVASPRIPVPPAVPPTSPASPGPASFRPPPAAATSVGTGPADLVIVGTPSLNPATPTKNVTFTVNITIRNQGGTDAPASTAFGTFQPNNELSPASVPAIPAGQTVNVQMFVTLKASGTGQSAVIVVDKYNTVSEGGGEGNNSVTISYNVN